MMKSFSFLLRRCGCAQKLSGIIIEGDECCKANTSGLISQGPSHGDVEYVFSSFKNDVGLYSMKTVLALVQFLQKKHEELMSNFYLIFTV